MSRRRKRIKKQAEERSESPAPEEFAEAAPSSENVSSEPELQEVAAIDGLEPVTDSDSVEPAIDSIQEEVEPASELETELPDLFEEEPIPDQRPNSQLPSGEDKKNVKIRRNPIEVNENGPARERFKKSNPITPKADGDVLSDLDDSLELDDPLATDLEPLDSDLDPDNLNTDSELEAIPEEAVSEPMAEEADPGDAFSWKTALGNRMSALSLLEKVSLGLLLAMLLISGIWVRSTVMAQLPDESLLTAKVKFPLKGQYGVIENVESYWRDPIREGANRDEGVSQSIGLIPSGVVTLGPESKAKYFRFLFRDESGTYVGDSATVAASNGKFSGSEDPTAKVSGATATINSTSGFLSRGEIISYLSDESLLWSFVILESVDGKNFSELISIPISNQLKDSQ